MKVGGKLALGFGALALVTLVNGVFSFLLLRQMDTTASLAYDNVTVPLGQLVKVAENFELIRVKLRDLILVATSASERDSLNTEIDRLQVEEKSALQECGKAIVGEKGQQLFTELDGANGPYNDTADQMQALMGQNKKTEALALLQGAGKDLANKFQTSIDELGAAGVGLAKQQNDAGHAELAQGLILSLAAVLGAALFSILVGVFLTRSITRPIQTLRLGLEEIAKGNLAFQRSEALEMRKDELGDLARSAIRMIVKVRDVLISMTTSSEQFTASGQGLSQRMRRTESVVIDVSQKINEVSDDVVTQSASVTQTSASAKQIVKNLESLGEVINQQAANVTQSSAAIEEMIANIGTVTVNVDHMVGTFAQLKESTDDGRAKVESLNEIISHVAEQSLMLQEANTMIKSIAAQTSLLSMNAAIEAAHAGEAGRGFAVVADEIRKLAEVSTLQSKEIGKNIKLIGTYINTGAEASRLAKAAFDTVLDRVGALGNQSTQVKTAMDEQSVGSKQILEAIAQINQITVKVQEGAAEMREGSLTIDDEMQKLLRLSENVLQKTTELRNGTQVITEAVGQAQQSSAKTIQLAEGMSEQMKQFTI